MSDWLTYSRAANLEELCDRDALHVAGGVRQLEGHKCFTSATAVLRLSAGMRCRDAEACGWQRRPCLPFQRRGKQRCRGLESRLCVSLCTHRSKGDGGVARLVGDLSIGAANGSAAIELEGGLPWAAAVYRQVKGQPRAVLNEARQLGWPSCKGQHAGVRQATSRMHASLQVRPAPLQQRLCKMCAVLQPAPGCRGPEWLQDFEPAAAAALQQRYSGTAAQQQQQVTCGDAHIATQALPVPKVRGHDPHLRPRDIHICSATGSMRLRTACSWVLPAPLAACESAAAATSWCARAAARCRRRSVKGRAGKRR